MTADTLIGMVVAAAAGPDATRPAVFHEDHELSYADLIQGARGIAGTLAEAGVGRGARVGLWMEKSPACLQAMLGVLWAGAAYVPLDPRAPWRRCRAIAVDCDLAALAVDAPRLPHVANLLEGRDLRLLLHDGAGGSTSPPPATPARATRPLAQALAREAPEPPFPDPDDLAYILYTSGSTGTPKGVVHTHRSGVAFARWIQDRLGIRRDDVFSSHAPFHFDLSISDLYASLGSGASVRLITATEAMLAPYLVRKVPEWGITVWYSVPSILIAMLEQGELEQRGFGRVRTLLFAGEVFPTPQLRRLRRALPGVRLLNLFGPTETNVCTYYEVPPEIPEQATASIPIGRACEHMETFVLDDGGGEAGVGTEGTLWVRGDNLMQGYWNDAERSARVLQPDPRGRPGVACCTGDRVRLEADGHYRFLGRRDHMIKVRGYRVELGEIESALAGHPAVAEAIAVPLPDARSGNRIVASVVLRAGASAQGEALRAFCGSLVPGYMVPERIDVRPSLPRTSTGKTDRMALRSDWEAKEG